MDTIEIESKISPWRHPFKWWEERKARRLMQKIINHRWNSGLGEVIQNATSHQLMTGHPVKVEAEKITCTVCKS